MYHVVDLDLAVSASHAEERYFRLGILCPRTRAVQRIFLRQRISSLQRYRRGCLHCHMVTDIVVSDELHQLVRRLQRTA